MSRNKLIKTTVLLTQENYTRLIDLAIEKYGKVKKVSQVLNEILNDYFSNKP